MNSYFLAGILGVLAFSFKNIGYVFQKKAVNTIRQTKKKQRIKDYFTNLRWILGITLPSIGGSLLILSYVFAPVSFVMPFTGVGLIVLVIFCHFYLKEEIRRIDWVAIGAILLGTLLITLTGRGGEASEDFIFDRFFSYRTLFFILIPNISLGLLSFFMRKNIIVGILLGIGAGVLGGSALVIQKPVAIHLGAVIANGGPLFLPILALLFVIILSFGAVALLNLAYQSGRGLYITPVYSIVQMLFPILGGIVVYDEWGALDAASLVAQGAGLLIVFVAIFIITAAQSSQ